MHVNLSFLRSSLICAAVTAASLNCRASSAADQAPKMKYEISMSHDAFFSPLGTKAESECNQLYHLLLDREMLMDPEQRKARLEVVKPILMQYNADMRELAQKYPSMQKGSDAIQTQSRQRLALLGDEETLKQINADAAGTDPQKAEDANVILINNRWTMAGGKLDEQTLVADSLEKLDHTYPKSAELAALTYKMSGEASSDQLHDTMLDLALGMDVPEAGKMAEMKKIREGAKATDKLVGQPFVLTGKTVDGKDFTTADWKGKVVLVDFWATWCGPCKAELPTIEKLYKENHDKGLEVIGVSNDYDIKPIAKFTSENPMPWPQLVDADAMKKHTWNSTTLDYGIMGIPRIFVIDRNGILLDAHANKDYEALISKALGEEKPM